MLGFIALRLLAAALGSMLYLLLAPAAVMAPALGDGGRAAFRGWATRLLSAVMSKLIYSFLLGVLLLMERILTVDLTALGWFTQWLLISTMWWGAFLHRHQMLNFAQGGRSESRVRGMRLTSALMSAREMGRVGGMVRRKLSPAAPSAEKRQRIADAARGRAKTIEDGQVGGSLEQNYREAQAQMAQAPEIQQRISGKQRQLARLKRNHDAAREKEQEIKRARKSALADPTLSSGVERKIAAARFDARFGDEERSHRRRAAESKSRMDRVQGEITAEQGSLTAARQTVNDGDKEKQKTGKPYTREQAAEQAQLFETQAALPDRGRAGRGGEKRNYAGVASIAKYGRRQYEELDAGGKRAAQLETDRELARLKAAKTTARDMATRPQSSLPPREQSKLNKDFDRKVEQQLGTGGHGPPPSRTKGSTSGSSQRNSRTERRSASGGESSPSARLPRGGRASQTPTRPRAMMEGSAGSRVAAGVRIAAGAAGVPLPRLATHTAGDRRAPRGRRGAGGDVPADDADDARRRGWPGLLSPARRKRRSDRQPVGSGKSEIPPEYLRLYEQAASGTTWTGRSSRGSARSSATTAATPIRRARRRARSTRPEPAGRCSSSRVHGRRTGWPPTAAESPIVGTRLTRSLGPRTTCTPRARRATTEGDLRLQPRGAGTWKRSRAGRRSTEAHPHVARDPGAAQPTGAAGGRPRKRRKPDADRVHPGRTRGARPDGRAPGAGFPKGCRRRCRRWSSRGTSCRNCRTGRAGIRIRGARPKRTARARVNYVLYRSGVRPIEEIVKDNPLGAGLRPPGETPARAAG